MNGLAATQQPAMDGSGQGQQVVMQAVEMLASGMSPEELVQQGIPAEVVQMAMQILAQESQQPMPQADMGLAGSMMAQGRV
jgi:hypothetical protein